MPRRRESDRPLVVISVSHYLKAQPGADLYPGLLEGLRALVDHLHARGFDAAYLLGDLTDLTVVEALQRERPHWALSWESVGVLRRRKLLSNADYLIASRMHPLISAVPRGIPFLGLNYAPKIRWLADDIGMSEHVLDIADCTPQRLIGAFGRLVEEREAITRFGYADIEIEVR